MSMPTKGNTQVEKNVTHKGFQTMDAKIKNAKKVIEKVEKKEFKGLLKEDHKLDNKRDRLEKQLAEKKAKR